MKYLEWKSDVSDEENFQIVSSRKSKKIREKQERKKRTPEEKVAILLMSPRLL
jgi:HKD family nuclease